MNLRILNLEHNFICKSIEKVISERGWIYSSHRYSYVLFEYTISNSEKIIGYEEWNINDSLFGK